MTTSTSGKPRFLDIRSHRNRPGSPELLLAASPWPATNQDCSLKRGRLSLSPREQGETLCIQRGNSLETPRLGRRDERRALLIAQSGVDLRAEHENRKKIFKWDLAVGRRFYLLRTNL